MGENTFFSKGLVFFNIFSCLFPLLAFFCDIDQIMPVCINFSQGNLKDFFLSNII